MLREFDYTTLTYERRVEIHDALAGSTAKHINSNSDLFSPLPYNPAKNPSQKLENVHLTPAPSTFEQINELANFANRLLAQATADALKQPNYISNTRYNLDKRHENLTFVTTHANIADVALWQEGWVEAAFEEHEDWQDRNGLGISRGVTTVGAFDMAASEVVQNMGHVFMSFPRTSTIDALNLDPLLIETNNRTMRKDVKHWMGADPIHRLLPAAGKVLHLAWEGKTTKVSYGDNHKPDGLQLGKVSRGTIDIVKDGRVQPVVIWETPEPIVVIGDLTEVKNSDDVLRVQRWQADTLANIIGISKDKVTIEGNH